MGLYILIQINCCEESDSSLSKMSFFPHRPIEILLFWNVERNLQISLISGASSQKNTTWGQDYRSATHNGLIMGKNVWSLSCALVLLSVEGNVKVQDTVFTAGLSGSWNVSFFSIALQLSLVWVWHGQLDSEELYLQNLRILFFS